MAPPLASSPADDALPETHTSEDDILAMSVSTKGLQRWRKVSIVLNSTLRFRSTKKKDPQLITHAVPATNCLELGAHTVSPEQLALLVPERNGHTLQEYGGVAGLACRLSTSLDNGMHDHSLQIQKRREEFGANSYPRQSSKGFFSFLLNACKDPGLFTFIVWALHSFASGIKSHGVKEGWYEGAAIAVAVILTILVTSFTDYGQGLQFQLNKNEEKQNILVDVARGRKRMKIPIFDLVVGDIAFLEVGDQVPADGLFVKGHSLCVDESTVTGESGPVHVNCAMPFLLSGCKVIEGFGKMLVTGVGIKTERGRFMAEPKEDAREETPLQVCLNGVTSFVRKIGWSVAVLVFLILLIVDFVGHKEGLNNSGKFEAGHRTVFATIVVLVMPKGLPLAVTLSLAYAMKRLMDDRALVRCFSACETMGSVTTICADKTGTLTLNQMTVVQAWLPGDFQDVEGDDLSTEVRSLILEGIAQNSTAAINIPVEGKEVELMGSPIEKALLKWGLKLGLDFHSVKSCSKVLQVDPFNSTKRCTGVVVRVGASGNLHAHWKGAAETILTKCVTILGNDNCKLPLTDSKKQELLNVIHGMGAHGLYCIAFGFRELEEVNVPKDEEQLEAWKVPEGPLTLTAIVGMKDPYRPGVVEAVQKCQAAGVMVRMITGDNLATAKAIATECHILQSGIAIEGSTFRNFTAEMKRQQLPRIAVMACASPSDKLSMVRALKELGEVVAVMGDGFNDASALNEADIGLSMGMEGTEAAKESSDIIILDNNFASVVSVVRWGRSIYINIQKFIQFQLTANVAVLSINFLAAVFVGDGPLTAVQLLWVNLIMGTSGALALVTEPPTDEELQRPPVQRKEPLISNIMIRNLVVQVLYQVVILLILQFRGKDILRLEGPDAKDINTTIIFNAFVLCQLFNMVNVRKPEDWNILKGLSYNRRFVGIMCITLALQVILVEFLSKFASTVKLSWQHWLICIVISFFTWAVALLGKLIPVPEKSLCNANLGPLSRTNSQANVAWSQSQTTEMSDNTEWIAAIY